MVLGNDPDLEPTVEEEALEAAEEPVMMGDACKWDDFLALIDVMQEDWASPEADTTAYREARAVRVFNAGELCG